MNFLKLTLTTLLLLATLVPNVYAQSEDDSAVSNPTARNQIYLPIVAGQPASVIEQMAALLPSNSDCSNCLTREVFLALPAEELARIEKSEQATNNFQIAN